MVKIFERFEKARLAGSTSLFGLLGSQDEFLDHKASGDNEIVRCKERLGGLLKYHELEAA